MTDVAIKRKVRDFVDIAHGDGRFKVYVQHGQFLANQRARVFGERSDGDAAPEPNDAQGWMCEEFFDVRMFGAVMSMKEHNAGQVRGPMQLTFRAFDQPDRAARLKHRRPRPEPGRRQPRGH